MEASPALPEFEPKAFTLTDGQQEAIDAVYDALLEGYEGGKEICIHGFPGVGKSTLLSSLLKLIPEWCELLSELGKEFPHPEIAITSTTHKACDVLNQMLTGDGLQYSARTIHSYLGLVVKPAPFGSREKPKLIQARDAESRHKGILIIDEHSFIGDSLENHIQNVKINSDLLVIRLGDLAQLPPINESATTGKVKGKHIYLNEIVRQSADNPIQDLVLGFHKTIMENGPIPSCVPDNVHITHLDREAFTAQALASFKGDWHSTDSTVIAWRNKTVIGYNTLVKQTLSGQDSFQAGDAAIVNSATRVGKVMLHNNAEIQIAGINYNVDHPLKGKGVAPPVHLARIAANGDTLDILFSDNYVTLEECLSRKLAKLDPFSSEHKQLMRAYENVVDLRPAYARTVNKSQGSTYKKVFIDLDDIGACRDHDLRNRLLYVGISRASESVVLTGGIR